MVLKIQFTSPVAGTSFFEFAEDLINEMDSLGKQRVSETYAVALRSYKRFRNDVDISLDRIDSSELMSYESYLNKRMLTPNTTSFYMRNLRAIYNRAVDQGLTVQKFPFKHVYTGIEKTQKRALSMRAIKRIKEIDLSGKSSLEFARDMFLFSFYTRGMSFIDMAYLRKSDVSGGVLKYRRKKTGQKILVKWESCMMEIVEKHDLPDSKYLLPVIDPHSALSERKQYIYSAHNINRSLKIIGKILKLDIPLTMYVSRHSWASIAKSKNVPLSVISEGMGHDSERTTRIYLTTMDTTAVDKANSLILKLI